MQQGRVSVPFIMTAIFLFLCSQTGWAGGQSAIQGPDCSGVIHGVVVDFSGQPARGMRVVAWPLGVDLGAMLPYAETDQAGQYRFEKVCPGRYTVLPADERAGYPDASPEWYEFVYGRRVAEVKLNAKHSLAELRVILPPRPGIVRIHVVDRKNKAEIQKFSVQLKVPGQRKPPWIEFLFGPSVEEPEIHVPPDKEVILHIRGERFREWSQSVGRGKVIRVPSGSRVTLEVELEPLQ